MNQKPKRVVPPHHQERLENLAVLLKEMRFADGKKQDGYFDMGVTRRQIQRGEYACNISILRLFSILDCYGCDLSDLEGLD